MDVSQVKGACASDIIPIAGVRVVVQEKNSVCYGHGLADRDGLQIEPRTMTLPSCSARSTRPSPQHSCPSPKTRGPRTSCPSIYRLYQSPFSLLFVSALAAWLYSFQHVVRPPARQRPCDQRRLERYLARCTLRRARKYHSAHVETCGECHVLRCLLSRIPKHSTLD